jgi:phage minor structural protein
MLYIFDSAEKLITTLPKGSFFDAVHYEVLNGENTFEFTVPAGNEYVVEGNLVAFRDLDSYWQVFEIKRLVDVHGDGLTRTAYCEHIFYELLDDIVIDKRPSADATAALAGMLDGTRWQVGIVDDLGASSTSAYYESALSAVQKVANAWKGELNWRCVISGGTITRYVDLKAMRGIDTGKQFAYSKDILNIEREVDTSGIVTALYGRGKGVELDSGSYGRRLTFADVIAADKPAGQEWIGDVDALSRWGRNGRHRFDIFVDEEETDPEVLLQKTRDELARRKVPRVTYRLDVVSLEQLTGYEHEAVRLGDLVRVIDREFEPELVVSARVIEIERDILDPANTKVVLGSFAPTIVEATINTARRVNDMANRPFNTKWLDGKINVLQNAIENTQSYVFQTGEDGILILDAPTYEQATKAMKLGGGIFAIANQKDGQGGWNWRTFGDGSGFTADLITAGMIDAGLIQIGPQTTFAPGYDPSQIEGASAVGMGVDADCLGLWHFDGSLNSHKGVAADSDALFGGGCFGQALSIATGKHLKVPTTDMLASEGVINFRAKNLSASANGSVLIDLPDSTNIEGLRVGISGDGKIYVEEIIMDWGDPDDFNQIETGFTTGTLNQVWQAEGGLQIDTTTTRTWNDFTGTSWNDLA